MAIKTYVKELPDSFIQELVEQLSCVSAVKGIFLAGSAAHKELLWCYENEEKLLSDVEVGVVVSKLSIRSKIRNIASIISRKYNYDVELFLVTPRRLRLGSPKNISFRSHVPNILMFDIINGGHWLYGDKNNFINNNFCSKDLPVWEGIRLILNRIGEGSNSLLPWFNKQSVTDQFELNRWLLKVLLAVGDAYIIKQKCYISGYSNRLKIWNEIQKEIQLDPYFSDIICKSYQIRSGKDTSLIFKNEDILISGIIECLATMLTEHSKLSVKNNTSQTKLLNDLTPIDHIPVRYQAPFQLFDQIFDSLFVIPNIIKTKLSWKLFIKSIYLGISIQSICYGVIYSGLLHFQNEGNWDWLNKNLDQQNLNSNHSTEKKLLQFWNAYCK